ncbi:MAG TPA: hypothetical protein VIJ50_05580 [Solirubrobacteraceae bacterium]
MPRHHRAATIGSSDDRMLEEITLAACAVAASCAGLAPSVAEEEIMKYAIGRLSARMYEHGEEVKLDALKHTAEVPRAEAVAQAAEAAADGLLEEAEQIEQGRGARRKFEDEAVAEVEVRNEEFGALSLIAKVAPRWRVTIVAMVATASGLGALARLSLEGVEDPLINILVTVAAVAAALSAELLLGTLGAEAYDGLQPNRRRAILLVPVILVVILILGTEIWAAIVRNNGVAATNVGPKLGSGGKLEPVGSTTPSLLWTAPLSVLVTMAGSGIVALTRIRDAANPTRNRLEEAHERLQGAREALRDEDARIERCRERAAEQRAASVKLRGEITSREIYGSQLVQAMQDLSERYKGYIEAVSAQAMLAYRAAAEAREHADQRSLRAFPRAGSALFGRYTAPFVFLFAIVVGVAAVEATASALAGVVAGAVVMLIATLAREPE